MRLHYYAHSTVHLTGEDGTSILIDPYAQSKFLSYDPTFDRADIVVVTHEHGDHNNVEAVPGDPEVVRGAGSHTARGIAFAGIASYHDRQQGAQRGPNTIVVFELDGLRIAHLGDQGVELDDDQYRQLEGVNVMLAPVGGGPTLEPEKVWELASRVRPNVLIPMHFKTDKVELPIAPVETFTEGKPAVRRPGGSEVQLSSGSLPEPTEVVVLDPSR